MCKNYLAALLLAAVVTPAMAVDTGTLTFKGKIIADTCSVDLNGANTNGIVTFNTLSQTSFGADKKVGDTQPVAITISDCDQSVSKLNVIFDGSRISGYDDQVLEATGTAANVGVRLLPEGSANYIKFNGAESDESLRKDNGANVVFNYTAEVIQVGSELPTAGDYSAEATYTLVYR